MKLGDSDVKELREGFFEGGLFLQEGRSGATRKWNLVDSFAVGDKGLDLAKDEVGVMEDVTIAGIAPGLQEFILNGMDSLIKGYWAIYTGFSEV